MKRAMTDLMFAGTAADIMKVVKNMKTVDTIETVDARVRPAPMHQGILCLDSRTKPRSKLRN
jgi:hypothetical protein